MNYESYFEALNEKMQHKLSISFFKDDSAIDNSIYPIYISIADIPSSGIVLKLQEQVYILNYVLSGSGNIYIDNKENYIKKGDGLILKGNEFHKYIYNSKPKMNMVFLFINGNLIYNFYNILNYQRKLKFSIPYYSHFGEILSSLIEYSKINTNANDNLYSNYLISLFTELMNYNQQEHIKDIDIPPLINEIQYFLQNHYKENISLDFLSEQFHISKFHLSREFKKYINLSPYEFLINTRIDKSKQLLLSTNLTISEISKQVGISDPNNFLYIFKNREHISPSQFKKKFTYNKKEINPLKKMSDKKD